LRILLLVEQRGTAAASTPTSSSSLRGPGPPRRLALEADWLHLLCHACAAPVDTTATGGGGGGGGGGGRSGMLPALLDIVVRARHR